MVPWLFHLNATSAARRGAHVSPVTYRSQRTKRAPDIPCPVPTRHQQSWSRRLFHSAQSIRLLETESRFSVDPELDLAYSDSFPAFSHDGKKLALNDIGNDPVVMASVSVMDADGTNASASFAERRAALRLPRNGRLRMIGSLLEKVFTFCLAVGQRALGKCVRTARNFTS